MVAVPQRGLSNQLGRTHGVASIGVFVGMALFCLGGLAFMVALVWGQLDRGFDILVWIGASGAAIVAGLIVTALAVAIESRRRGV